MGTKIKKGVDYESAPFLCCTLRQLEQGEKSVVSTFPIQIRKKKEKRLEKSSFMRYIKHVGTH